jgi:hypothetical protein
MLNGKNGIVNDEMGGFFVFGPWWFVILVMIVVFIASALKSNEVNDKNPEKIYDYDPSKIIDNPLKSPNNCPTCGKNNSLSAKFCSGCGGTLMEDNTVYCPECGGINQRSAKFCQECGKKLIIH